ncbi:MAG: hypothetical protein ACP5HM_10860 [Anaerolineae bacterium]
MTRKQQRHDSFVLRIWWEEDEGGVSIWRGWVQHATSGEVAYVQTTRELWTFIEAHTEEAKENEE